MKKPIGKNPSLGWPFLFATLLLAIISTLPAIATDEAWVQRYSHLADADDSGQKVITDGDGNVIVAGYTSTGTTGDDWLVIKYSSVGVPLWTNYYNGPANESDRPNGLAVDGSGNVFVTGSCAASGGLGDFATVVYSAAGMPIWTNRYDGPGNSNDIARAVAVAGNGDVLVTGSSIGSDNSLDYATVAYTSVGEPIWTNRYNGPIGGADEAQALALSSNGNVFVTGFSAGSGSSLDYATVAYSASGLPLWTNRYNGPGNGGDRAKAVGVDFAGKVFITGYSWGLDSKDDYATIAYSATGIPLWTNRYRHPSPVIGSTASANALAVDGTGSVIVTGFSFGTNNQDFATIKYSGVGVPLWTNRYAGVGSGIDVAQSVAVDGSGQVFVTGESLGSGFSVGYATVAYSSTGTPLWTNRYNGPAGNNDRARLVAVSAGGNVFVTGDSLGSSGSLDVATVAYSGAGVAIWTNRYNGPANGSDQAFAMAVGGSGDIFVTGSSSVTGGNFDYATVAFSSTGVALWTNRYDGPVSGYDRAHDVGVDTVGNVFITGVSIGSDSYLAYATLAYSPTGIPLWTNRYNGPGNSSQANALAVAQNGNVFVTGYTSSGGSDYATIGYSNSGVPLWTNRYDGLAGSDRATAIAVDSNGNVVVTGNSAGTVSSTDYATVAYSDTGVPLWTNRYNGPVVTGYDYANAIATDRSGNVFVAGYSQGNGSSDDYATLAYSASGTPLWTNRYNGPASSTDQAQALAVDDNGNVFVTGWSMGIGSSVDFATVAYSGLGVPLWTNRYDGPANGGDTATAIAIDGLGNVLVTGNSSTTAENWADYVTVAYSSAGVPLWTNRYNGPANGPDYPVGIVADANNHVIVGGYSDGDRSNGQIPDYAIVKYIPIFPPMITVQPTNVTVIAGNPALLSVMTTGAAPLHYQWRFNGVPISGDTNNNLTISHANPGNQGNYDVVITNSYGATTSAVATLTVTCPVIAVNPLMQSNLVVGLAQTQQLSAVGGASPWTFAVTGGALPPGIALSAGGLLTGSPTNTGLSNFQVTATDVNGCSGMAGFAITVACTTITLNPLTLPDALIPNAYSNVLVASGGVAPYQYSIVSGALPPGLSLAANGVLFGIPTNTGTYEFTARVTDAYGCIMERPYSIFSWCGAFGGTSNDDDLIDFSGSLQQASLILTNSYTSEVVVRSGNFVVNCSSYDGMAGTDVMLMSNLGDAIQVRRGELQIVKNIEVFIAGDGDDVLDLADVTFTLPSMVLFGGAGDDIIWGNVGNDFISGSDGNDIINGGPGNDTIYGENDNDLIYFGIGSGSDTNSGGSGFDEIVFAAGTTRSDVVIAPRVFTNAVSSNLLFHVQVGVMGDQFYSDTIERLRFADNSTIELRSPWIITNPTNITANPGTNTSLQITLSGLETLRYQWWKNSQPLAGETNRVLSFASLIPADAGNYFVVVTNIYGATTSAVATVTVNCPVVGLTPPNLPAGVVGSAYSQSLMATGGLPPYAFGVSSGALPGGLTLSASGQLTGIPTNVGSFNFAITATDTNGCSGLLAYNVNVTCPAITLSPTNLPAAVAGTAYGQLLSASGGVAPYSFAVTNGSLPGGLNLSGGGMLAGTPTNTGAFNFTVVCTDTNGCTGQRAYTLMALGAPQITAQPQSRTNLSGTLADFSVTASGTAPLAFQWWKGSTPLANQTNSTYTIASVTTNDAGTFFVVVTNTAGSVTSAVASLTVWQVPSITAQPLSTTNQAGAVATFNVTAQGTSPLTYRWRKDGFALSDSGNIFGASTASLSVSNLGLSDAANYTVVITNIAGGITSAVAALTVQAPPIITSHPQSRTNDINSLAFFSATATGSAPLRYQWWKNLAPLANATNDTLTIPTVATNDAGDYQVVVTNHYGSATSAVATLTVVVTNPPGIDIVWTNAGSGSWHDAANWQPNQVPGFLDSATIAKSVTVTIGSPAIVSNLSFALATLEGTDVLAVGGTLLWTNSILGGKLVVLPTGKMIFTNSATKTFNGVLTNRGEVQWSQSTLYGNAAIIHNEGQWQMDGNLTFSVFSGSNAFYNTGTFRKTGGTGTGNIGWHFNTTGFMDVTNGALNVADWIGLNVLQGTLNWEGIFNGVMLVQTNGRLSFATATTRTFSGGVLTNRGEVLWNGGSIHGNSSVVCNEGLWLMTDDVLLLVNSGTNKFINTGTMRKSGGAGFANIGWEFGTTGTIDATNGSLILSSWSEPSIVNGRFNWNGGALSTTALVANNAVVNWLSGTAGGVLTVDTGGALHLSGASAKTLSGVLTNRGVFMWNAGPIFGTSGSIYNEGLWVMTDDLYMAVNSGSNVFVNVGTFSKTGGSFAGTVGWYFNTTGFINATNGYLSVANWIGMNVLQGDLNWEGSFDGVMLIETNGTLNITGTAARNMVGSVLTNRGMVNWSGGHIFGTSARIYNEAQWQMEGELTLGLNSGTNIFHNSGVFGKRSGMATATLGWEFGTTGIMDVTNGALYLPYWSQPSVLHGTMNWDGGTMIGNSEVAGDGALNWLNGSVNGSLTVAVGGKLGIKGPNTRFVNGSLTNYGTVAWNSGAIYGNSGTIHNQGLWLLEGDLTLGVNSGSNTFLNNGEFNKTAGVAAASIGWEFGTTGSMNVTNGALYLPYWSRPSALHGTLNWDGGAMSGITEVASDGTLNWRNGSVDGGLTIGAGGTLSIDGSSTRYIGGALTNRGTVLWNNGGIYGNNGTIRNEGLWQIRTDGTIGVNSGLNTFLNSGTLQKSFGTSSAQMGWNFENSGEVELLSGQLYLSSSARQTAGRTTLSIGTLQSAGPFQLMGGALSGTNVFLGTLVNSDGTLQPGFSTGKLRIQGDYTQTNNGILQIEIAGHTPGITFDRLEVTGAAQLGGVLSVTLTNGFAPTNGSAFAFLSASSRTGSFANFSYPSNTVSMSLDYLGNGVNVIVTNTLAVTAPTIVSGPILDSGNFVIRFLGATGETYTIERTPLLMPASWMKLTNLVAPTTNAGYGVGVFELRDPVSTATNRFYRAVHPAY